MGTIKDMKSLHLYLLILVLFALKTNCQRVVPGVNPQHYQHVPVQQQQQYQQQHPQQPQQYQQQHIAPGHNPQQYQQHPQQQQQQQQQYQQQQQQQQQVPVQQQAPHPQAPQQQMHQQVPQGHVPQQQHQQQQHHAQHAPHGHQQQVLHAGNMDEERAHIQEHMQVPIDTSKMSEAELQFHYFKMHDSDNNNMLDGCELIKSLIHWHDEEKKPNSPEGTGKKDGAVYTDKGLSEVIDYVLSTMDKNNDGYVDYMEYRQSEEGQAKGA